MKISKNILLDTLAQIFKNDLKNEFPIAFWFMQFLVQTVNSLQVLASWNVMQAAKISNDEVYQRLLTVEGTLSYHMNNTCY